ncbi:MULTISPECIES: hypothetical protein [Vibrionaceae]|nr:MULTISPECIES: hypothetical protein [Vibrionaceae]QSV13257.1 hypothetical protein FH974_10945 [Photobacterium ganghwense]
MAVTKGLVSKIKAVLGDEELLGFLTEEECRSVMEVLEKEVEVKQTTATD